MAGFESNGNYNVAKYWKNGVPTILSNGSYSLANDIIILKSDIYVVGWERVKGYSVSIAKYWKNGASVDLTDGSNDAEARAITLVENDVYIAGHE